MDTAGTVLDDPGGAAARAVLPGEGAAAATTGDGQPTGGEGSPGGPPQPVEGGLGAAERQELENLRATLGRQGNEVGDLRKQVARYEQLLAQREEQPPAAQVDDQQQLYERLRPALERRMARYATQGYKEDDARQLAWEDVWEAHQEREATRSELLDEVRRDVMPILDTVGGTGAVASLIEGDLQQAGIEGITPQDVAGHLRSKGVSLSTLQGYDPAVRAAVVEEIGWAVAGRKAAEARKALASRAVPAQGAPGGGPPMGGPSRGAAPDSAIEANARALAAISPGIPYEKHLETARRAAARKAGR